MKFEDFMEKFPKPEPPEILELIGSLEVILGRTLRIVRSPTLCRDTVDRELPGDISKTLDRIREWKRAGSRAALESHP